MRTSEASDETSSLSLHLLDAAQGHPVQAWRFEDCKRISIGRAAESDISLADPQVSRTHVELVYRRDHWVLRSLGRNGTWINGVLVSEVRLLDRAIFQLGASGPSFQFAMVRDSVSNLATIDHIDPASLDFLVVDEQRKAQEVQQIIDGESFKLLRQQALDLKREARSRGDGA